MQASDTHFDKGRHHENAQREANGAHNEGCCDQDQYKDCGHSVIRLSFLAKVLHVLGRDWRLALELSLGEAGVAAHVGQVIQHVVHDWHPHQRLLLVPIRREPLLHVT